MLETAFARCINRQMILFWGCRSRSDLYLIDEPLNWQQTHPNFRFVPVLSEAAKDTSWSGATGLVHGAVMHQFPDLSGYQVYACGAPAMIAAARADFVSRCALPRAEFFSDAFVTEADVAAGNEQRQEPASPLAILTASRTIEVT
jgi:CDP-4-dehydro-6-deoxyglucose reductase